MKHIFLSVFIMMFALSGIAHAQSRSTKKEGIFCLTDTEWPQSVNPKQDISKMSYQELYYLKSLVYATHGCWFTDGEVAQMLASKAPWYNDLMWERQQQYYKDHPDDYDESSFKNFLKGTELSKDEKAFIKKIDSKMAALKSKRKKKQDLESTDLCINLCQLENPSADFIDKLNSYNFVIEQTDCEQLFNIYEQNDYSMMPSFITTDTYLQLAHMYLSYVQKYIEQQYFAKTLSNTFDALSSTAKKMSASTKDAKTKKRIEYVMTYAAIGKSLLTAKKQTVPASMQKAYDMEMKNLRELQDRPSAMMQTDINFRYSMFRPRGHYTRNEKGKRFFMSMMWAQTAAFLNKKDESVKNAATLAIVYNSLSANQRQDFEHMGDLITQLTGVPDNVSILQLASWMSTQKIKVTDLDNAQVLASIKNELRRLNATQNRINTNDEPDDFKINLMPQRYLADNEVLRAMVDEKPMAERAQPRGLDVLAAFGSQPAEDVLYNFYKDNEKWGDFTPTLQKMKQKFAGKPVGIGTIYDQRLQILVNMVARHDKQTCYAFYNTKDWEKKELNTSLASWATLKHDAILYGEQPDAAECGDGEELPKPQPMGFVEPNLPFWTELEKLITDTKQWLNKSGYLDDELSAKSENLTSAIQFCKEICEKELKGEAPSYEDCARIRCEGSSLEYMTLGLIDPDLYLQSWELVTGADKKIAQVADYFTREVLGCDKNGIRYAAVGNANALYVLVKIGEKVYVTRGATYGYYEFTLPQDQPRLTDEEWQEQLEKGTPFRLQEWLQPYILNGTIKMDERNFYGSGC